MNRALKFGGQLIVLEFLMPQNFPIKQLYYFYFKNILPIIGKMVSKDTFAYSYLFESVQSFPYGKAFTNILEECNFKNTECIPLSFGIASIYKGIK